MLLAFTCATHDSARRVALAGGWDGLAERPDDCRSLQGQRLENRIAIVVEIVEILQLPSGEWVQIGRVKRLFGPVAYSAGHTNAGPVA